MTDVTDLVQVIDESGSIIETDKFNHLVSKWSLLQKGFDYHIVAILGPQSGGKSTLLNLLFGTTFLTLEAQKQGRVQVTKGIWMGHASVQSASKDAVVVMDVEGVDGRERGEKEAAFERKTSLFSLVLADVLIVNMWHQDVGRYNAGNIALLKIVFEQHLRLFGKSRQKKTHLLFVIRDHAASETPLKQLEGIIMDSLNEIWTEITKAASLSDFSRSKLQDFFDFSFVGLAHKVYKPEEFMKDVSELRSRFLESSNKDFIFQHIEKRDVPADGISHYATEIWKVIKENKDLDLPSQKEMLAMFRCSEMLEAAKLSFNQQIGPVRSALEKGIVEDFGKKISEIYFGVLAQYDSTASRYHQPTATKIRNTLSETLLVELSALYAKQIRQLYEKTVTFFEKLVEDAFPADAPATNEFSKIEKSIMSSTIEYFEGPATGSVLKDSDWSFASELEELKQHLHKNLEAIKQRELKKLVEEMKTVVSGHIQKPLEKILESPETNFWGQVRKLFNVAKERAAETLQERLKGFPIEEKERVKRIEGVQAVAFDTLKEIFKGKVKIVEYLLNKKFDEIFQLDSQGVPRRWKHGDDVKSYFLKARAKAMEVLELFCFLRLNPDHDDIKYIETAGEHVDDSLVILSFEECKRIKDNFEKETNTAYMQALRDQEHASSTAQIPMYIILLIVFLGFDEFMHLITSPMLLFFTILLGAGGYVLYALNLLGPAQKVLETLLHASFASLRGFVAEQYTKAHEGQTRPITSGNNNNTTSGSTDKPKTE